MSDKQLRIVQIIDRLQFGGAERVLVTLANVLHQHGHQVKVVTTVSPGPLVNQLATGIQHVNLGRKWKWNILTMRRLVNEIKDGDIIHVHSSHNLRYIYLATKLFRLKKPIFFHEHFGDIHIDGSVHWHQRIIYPNVIFIGVSRRHTQWAQQHLKMPSERIYLLPNTVEKLPVIIREDRTPGSKQLVLVSNFRTSKNIGFAIEVFRFLKEAALFSYHLTIIGQIADEAYFREIEHAIIQNELQDDITILTGNTSIQPLLNRFDLALHTAVSESGPLVLIEYLAQGLPFITYNTGEVVEEIKSKIPLAVMHSFEVYEWCNRIETLLTLPSDDLTHRFSNVYDHYFSTEGYYKRLMGIYADVLRKSERIKNAAGH